MKPSKEQMLFTRDLGKLIEFAYSVGIYLTVGDAYRSNSQVLLNYYGKKVVENNGVLSLEDSPKVSWTKHSNHASRLAQDYNFFVLDGEGNPTLTYKYEDTKALGEFWEGLDEKNKWGGFWKNKDVPHFERRI